MRLCEELANDTLKLPLIEFDILLRVLCEVALLVSIKLDDVSISVRPTCHKTGNREVQPRAEFH